MSAANTLKVLRVASGLDQKQLAEKAGVSPSYVSVMESGEREPPLTYLRKVSRALDIPVSVLVFQTEEPSETLSPVQRAENERLQKMLNEILTTLLQVPSWHNKKSSSKTKKVEAL